MRQSYSKRRHLLVALVLVAAGSELQVRAQQASPAPPRALALRRSGYRLRPGESVPVDGPAESLDFLVHAASRRVEIAGRPVSGIVVAPDVSGRIVLAASLRMPAGHYSLLLAAAAPDGEQRQSVLDVALDPMQTVPDSATQPPVVALNGWQFGVSNGGCPVSGGPSGTFGTHFVPSLTAAPVNAPVVYFFDNCVECPNCTIEELGNDLSQVLALIHFQAGALVPQVDLVTHSLGGLIARSYLAGIQTDGTLLPPKVPRVRKLVLIASPNFGAFAADSYIADALFVKGVQTSEMKPGSTFLWLLATWNQQGDALRGVDALAIVGSAGACGVGYEPAPCQPHANDGIVSVTSASVGFAGLDSSRTRVLPYCHAEPLRLLYCNGAPAIANVDEASGTSQILLSFLSGSSGWTSVGDAASSDPNLSHYGGMYLAWIDQNNQYVSDVSQALAGTVTLQPGAWSGTVFFDEFLPAGLVQVQLTSASLGANSCGSIAEPAGFFTAVRCKFEPVIYYVTPLLPTSPGLLVQSGTAITINGVGFGQSCIGCQVFAAGNALTVSSWNDTAITAFLPAADTGLVPIQVQAAFGADAINIVAAPAARIVSTPSSLQFNVTVGASAPASQTVQITNTGGGNLAWTAAAGAAWITLSPPSGNAPASLTITVNPAGLPVGTYSDIVEINSPSAPGNPFPLAVKLLVEPPPAPAVQLSAAVNGASFQGALASGTWVSIFGSNLANTTRSWAAGDFVNGKLPTSLDGVSVSIDGLPAYIAYISPAQINALAPDDPATGLVQIQVTAPQGASNSLSVQKQAVAPALFILTGSYAAAEHADGTYVGKPGLIPGVVTRPAQPGETIVLFGTGFGPAKPPVPANELVAAPVPLAGTVQASIGGMPGAVAYAGLVESGLNQINFKVPNVPDGDQAVVLTVAGQQTQSGVFITVQK